jgi:hypothetical protein
MPTLTAMMDLLMGWVGGWVVRRGVVMMREKEKRRDTFDLTGGYIAVER